MESLYHVLGIEDCLMRRKDVEIILIDNGSTNKEQIDFINTLDLDQKILLPTNLGENGGFNSCPKLETKYVLLSEDDVEYIEPLEKYIEVMETYGDCGVVTGCLAKEKFLFPETEIKYCDKLGYNILTLRAIRSTNMFMLSETFENLRPFAEGSVFDFDWFIMDRHPKSICNMGLTLLYPWGFISYRE